MRPPVRVSSLAKLTEIFTCRQAPKKWVSRQGPKRPAVWWEVGQVGFALVADPPPYSRLLGFWVPVVGPLNPLNPLEGFRTSSRGPITAYYARC
jgi:hypothetical protein